jgi:hypothetical protein
MNAKPLALLLWAMLGAKPAAPAEADPAAARKLVEAAYDQRRVVTMRTEMTMTLVDGAREWIRSAQQLVKRRTEIDDDQLFLFTAPAELAGSAVLTRERREGEDDQWVYVPAYHTVRRIPAANRGDAYLGTDFFYEDVLDPRWDEYAFREIAREVVGPYACVLIEAVPSAAARSHTAYSRTVYWVDPQRLLIVRQDYWDHSGKLLKRLQHSELRTYVRYRLWDHTVMENLQTRHKTTIVVRRREVDVPLPDDVFTQKALKRG